jgi:hypothetical protein
VSIVGVSIVEIGIAGEAFKPALVLVCGDFWEGEIRMLIVILMVRSTFLGAWSQRCQNDSEVVSFTNA